MNSTAKFAGLDVSKATTAVAVAEGHAPPWYLGSIPNTPEAVRKLVKRGRPATGAATSGELSATAWSGVASKDETLVGHLPAVAGQGELQPPTVGKNLAKWVGGSKLSISRHWMPGDSVVLRRVWRRKLCRVTAATVVQDTPELIALYWRKGCPLKVTGGPLSPTRLLSAERLDLVDGVWGGTDVLMLVSPRAAHAVYAMWESGHASFVGWYVNLQEPVRRTPVGFDTMDHWLDIVISRDRSEWRWKDEHEFAEAVTAGVLSADQARAIRAEGERAIRLVQAGPASFYDAWEAWLPPTEWKIPELPSGWDSIAPDVVSL